MHAAERRGRFPALSARAGTGLSVLDRPGKLLEPLIEQLCAWAAFETKLVRKDENGVSLKDRYESFHRRHRRWPRQVEERPDDPGALLYLWEAYQSIALGRRSGGMGGESLSWNDIHYWQSVSGVRLTRAEAEVVLRIDAACTAALTPKKKKVQARDEPED
jgi:hypothetical protein